MAGQHRKAAWLIASHTAFPPSMIYLEFIACQHHLKVSQSVLKKISVTASGFNRSFKKLLAHSLHVHVRLCGQICWRVNVLSEFGSGRDRDRENC